MCLFYSKVKTKRYRSRSRSSKFITVYKIFQKSKKTGKLYSIYFRQTSPIKRGWFKSNRHSIQLNELDDNISDGIIYVNRGIYVFRDRQTAIKEYRYIIYDNKVIVKCKALLKDFVGCNNKCDELVFMKIFIPRAAKPRMRKNRAI